MIGPRTLAEAHTSAGAFHRLLPVQAAIEPGVFLNKDGSVMILLRGMDFDPEGRDAPELEMVCQRLQAALRPFGPGYRIYQYFVSRPHPPIESNVVGQSAFAQAAAAERIAFLNEKRLFQQELYWCVLKESERAARPVGDFIAQLISDPRQAFARAFSTAASKSSLDQAIRASANELRGKVDQLLGETADLLRLSILDTNAASNFLRYLVNLSPSRVATKGLKYTDFVDYQLPGSTLEAHRDHLRLDDQYVRVLTMKEPPAKTFANMLHGVCGVNASYVVATEWSPRSEPEVRRAIHSMRRHYHNKKSSPMAHINSTGSSSDFLIDDGAVAVARELGGSLEAIDVGDVRFGQFSLTIVVHDSDPAEVPPAMAEFFKAFSTSGGQLIQESYNTLNAYLAVFPGNRAFNLRSLWLSSVNHADLAMAFRVGSGEPFSSHLRAEHLTVLETSNRTPYFLNLHYEDVGHWLMLGSTGSGKSFSLNFFVTQAQKYAPWTIVFDLDGGFRNTASQFGGKHLAIGSDSAWPKINPFALAPSPDNLRFLVSFFRVLVESGGYALTAADERDLLEQIENLYSIEPAQRRLLTLCNIVRRPLQEPLRRWVEGGLYGSLFDHADDELTFAEFQSFDFHGMERSPIVLEALLFYILFRANSAVESAGERARLKLFVIDEAWRFLRHPTTRAYITEILKTGRKKNAAMMIATQSPDDLIQSEMLQIVAEGCPTKLFLANPGLDREQYRKIFHLTETEVEMIAALTPKRRLLLKRPDHTKLLHLEVDRKGYWLYTSDPNDVARRQQCFDEHGFAKGLEILTRS